MGGDELTEVHDNIPSRKVVDFEDLRVVEFGQIDGDALLGGDLEVAGRAPAPRWAQGKCPADEEVLDEPAVGRKERHELREEVRGAADGRVYSGEEEEDEAEDHHEKLGGLRVEDDGDDVGPARHVPAHHTALETHFLRRSRLLSQWRQQGIRA